MNQRIARRQKRSRGDVTTLELLLSMTIEERIRVVAELMPNESISVATLAEWLNECAAPAAPNAEVDIQVDDLTGREVAKLLRVSPSTVRTYRLNGMFPTAWSGTNGWMYPKAAVKEYIERRREAGRVKAAEITKEHNARRAQDLTTARLSSASDTSSARGSLDPVKLVAPSSRNITGEGQTLADIPVKAGQPSGRRRTGDRAWRKATARGHGR